MSSEYGQIARDLRLKLVRGEYEPGEQLPTVRDLAEQRRVNHNTVAAAYRLLAAEGWIDLRRRRGAVVLERKAPKPSRRDVEMFRDRIEEAVAEARSEGVETSTIASVLQRFVTDLGKTRRR